MDASLAKIYMQTDYTEETAKDKLAQFGGDVNKVIRDYLGLEPTMSVAPKPKKTLNQEIYRQFREKIQISDGVMPLGK